MKTRYTTEIFIEKAIEVHGNKYDYSKVNYRGSKEKICIICPKHGEFWQYPSKHLLGDGCAKCGFDKLHTLKKKDKNTFIKEAKEFKMLNGNVTKRQKSIICFLASVPIISFFLIK